MEGRPRPAAAYAIDKAADNTLAEIAAIGGDGGLIVLDVKGNYAMRFNTSGMFRGPIGNDGMAPRGWCFCGARNTSYTG